MPSSSQQLEFPQAWRRRTWECLGKRRLLIGTLEAAAFIFIPIPTSTLVISSHLVSAEFSLFCPQQFRRRSHARPVVLLWLGSTPLSTQLVPQPLPATTLTTTEKYTNMFSKAALLVTLSASARIVLAQDIPGFTPLASRRFTYTALVRRPTGMVDRHLC